MNPPSLTPELAGKILRADLKNLIDKVSGGKPLNGQERNMFEKLRFNPDEIQAKRQLSLVERWSNGKRLNPEELREIADVIPPQPHLEENEGHGGDPDFSLESESPSKSGPKWEEWSDLYGSSARTLKRWASIGRDKGDECPLWDASSMPGWWTRNMTQRIPHKVLLAGKGGKDVPSEKCEAGNVADAATGDRRHEDDRPQEGREFVGASEDEMGIEATLRRIEDSEVFAHRLYREAIEKGDENKALIAERSFRQMAKDKVDVQRKVIDYRKETRDLIPRVKAEAVLSELHQDLFLRFRGFGEPMLRRFGIPVTAENLAAWHELVDDLCIALREEVFRAS